MGDDPPVMTTTKEWRDSMVAARTAAEMTPHELADRVGTSQNVIWNIENGHTATSKFIPKICKVLRIPAPAQFINDEQRRWSMLGHRLEQRNEEQFRSAMALIESMLKAEEESGSPPTPPAPTITPPKKKARAIGSANIAAPAGSRLLRDADETPHEAVIRKRTR